VAPSFQSAKPNQFPGRINALGLQAEGCKNKPRLMTMRGKLLQAGKTGKMILGAVMIALAALILSVIDRQIEAWLVDHSPAWVTKLTTQF
jgi:hypothetical protein